MNKLLLLLSLIFSATSWAIDPPVSPKGQQASTKLTYKYNLNVPNYQATNLGGIDALFETGNNNILDNASFEHSTFSTSWTNSAGTFTAESTVVVHGKKSAKLVLSAQTMVLTQDSTLYQAQYADGVQGLLTVKIKSSLALNVCARQAGVTSTTLCVVTSTDSKWKSYKVPYILGATSNGISIASSGSVSGTVYIDDARVEAIDVKQDVPFCNSAACTTNFSAIIDPTDVVSNENVDWINGDCTDGVGGFSVCVPISGTFSVMPNCGCNRDGSQTGQCQWDKTLSSTTALYFYVTNSSGTANNDDLNIWCERAGADKTAAEKAKIGSTFSSANADTGWESCGHTTSDFTDFGTVTSIETMCKRQGDTLLMMGNFTAGSSADLTAAKIALKFRGTSLTSQAFANIRKAGTYLRGFANASHGGGILSRPSVSYISFSSVDTFSNTSSNALTESVASGVGGSGRVVSFDAVIPISGWENSNLIIGIFSETMAVPGLSKPKTCYYDFGGTGSSASPTECTSGTCVEYYDSCLSGTPPAWSTVGKYQGLTFAAGTFGNSVKVKCSCEAYDATTATNRECLPKFITGQNPLLSDASGGYVVNMTVTDGASTEGTAYVSVKCEGQGP